MDVYLESVWGCCNTRTGHSYRRLWHRCLQDKLLECVGVL